MRLQLHWVTCLENHGRWSRGQTASSNPEIDSAPCLGSEEPFHPLGLHVDSATAFEQLILLRMLLEYPCPTASCVLCESSNDGIGEGDCQWFKSRVRVVWLASPGLILSKNLLTLRLPLSHLQNSCKFSPTFGSQKLRHLLLPI